MESSYIGLLCFWGLLILVFVSGYLLKLNDRKSYRNRTEYQDAEYRVVNIHENSTFFPYLTILESDYFFTILTVLSLGLVVYSSLLAANVV